jgi:putative peptidoglycan lipid II flippase
VKASKPANGGQTAHEDRRREHAGIAGAAGVLGGLTLLSRIAGLLRDVTIGALFGASPAADAFFIAFRIPNLFRRIVAEGAASTAFVPVFTSRLVEGGRPAALAASGAVGGAAAMTLSVVVLIGVLCADQVVSLFAPGFADDPAKRALTVSLTAWTFPYLLLVGMGAWAMGTLHTFRRFAPPAYGPILLNIAIITAALTLGGVFEQPVMALVVGVLVGGTLQFGVQLPALKREGLTAAALTRLSDASVGRVGGLLVPTLFGGAVYQINILVATMLASLLPDRSVSYLWYADRIFEFPLGIIAVAVGTAALPSLSAQAGARRWDDMAASIAYSLRLVWSLCIPATLGLWLLAPAIVTALFRRGEFAAVDAAQTAWALRAYCVGLLGVASVRVLVSVFYALETPRVTVIVAALALVVNAMSDLALMGPTDPTAPWWGAQSFAALGDLLRVADLRHAGLALGTSIAATVNAVVLFGLVRRRLPMLARRPLAASASIHAAAAVAMAAVVIAWQAFAQRFPGTSGAWLEVGGAVVLGAGVYAGAGWLLGSSEIADFVRFARRRLG